MRAAPPPPPNEPDILALIDEAELAVNTDTSITIDDWLTRVFRSMVFRLRHESIAIVSLARR